MSSARFCVRRCAAGGGAGGGGGGGGDSCGAYEHVLLAPGMSEAGVREAVAGAIGLPVDTLIGHEPL